MKLFKKKTTTDWMLLHAVRGTWKITTTNATYDDYCNYEISYSPSEDKVKIEMEGYKPKGHKIYESVMKVLTIYNKAILSNQPFTEIKNEIDNLLIDKSKEK
jgi:hypothetical protein